MDNDNGPPTILIVEDERALADLYADFLNSYTVRTTYSGQEALDAISDEIDVVLLDRRMPGLSGEEVLDEIRATEYECRVAMVTAVTPDVDILEMGFDDYLTKPVEMEDLVETVERLLELNNYDELVEEYYQLASKKAALVAGQSDVDVGEHDEIGRLTARVEQIEQELEASGDAIAEADIRSLLR